MGRYGIVLPGDKEHTHIERRYSEADGGDGMGFCLECGADMGEAAPVRRQPVVVGIPLTADLWVATGHSWFPVIYDGAPACSYPQGARFWDEVVEPVDDGVFVTLCPELTIREAIGAYGRGSVMHHHAITHAARCTLQHG